MVDFIQEFQIWTVTETAWSLEMTTAYLESATELFLQLNKKEIDVALYEKGDFLYRNKARQGLIAILWSNGLNEHMGRECTEFKRGFGVSDDYGTYVEYYFPGKEEWNAELDESLKEEKLRQSRNSDPEPPYVHGPDPILGYSLALTKPNNGETSESAYRIEQHAVRRYAERACDGCGLLVPANLLTSYSHEVETGRTSGTTRTSRSTSTYNGSRSFSTTSRSGQSQTSGKRYYKNETLALCEVCLRVRQKEDFKKIVGVIALFGIGLFFIIISKMH